MTTKSVLPKNSPKPLKRTEFGNQILREATRYLSQADIASREIQKLIQDMRHTLVSVKLGIGLAAPQVGEAIALAVIMIQPTKHRPDVEPFEAVLINPVIVQTFGSKKQLWEGCISSGKERAGLFAKVPRYKRIKINYTDENGKRHDKEFEGLQAHVIQHEIDHLNGILFIDKVKDTKTYMTYSEYMKYIKKGKK